jgi:lipoprotein-releasing system ATP-binding protein
MFVEVKNLTKTHAARAEFSDVPVLRGLDFGLETGRSAAIVGPSGAGKSTFLNILGGLDKADSGTISVGGQDPGALAGAALSDYRRRRVGFVFQAHHLLPQCSVLENVLVPFLSVPKAERVAAQVLGRELLEALGLGDRLNHLPSQISGGEKQRVAVARALAGRPQLILADEPTGALDRSNALQLWSLLKRMQKERGVSLLAVTHSLELARQLDDVWELRDGRLEPAA